jgi:predicted metal-dependent hydrolase
VHPLLRYTLDLFEALPEPPQSTRPSPTGTFEKSKPFRPPALDGIEDSAAKNIAAEPSLFAHPQANRELRLNHVLARYRLDRGRRRSIGFVVGPDGLVVRAPKWTPQFEIDAALRSKSDWIVRKLGESRERQIRQAQVHIEWRDGVVVPYLGGELKVLIDSGHTHVRSAKALALECDPGGGPSVLRIAVARDALPEQIRDAVQAWLMRQAKTHFEGRLNHFAGMLQVKWTKLRLSNASTRWGSASADGSIRLNWRLIHMRETVIDYVVAHELSHLRVMDHSPRFWDTVRTVVPDYAVLRAQLKDDPAPRW